MAIEQLFPPPSDGLTEVSAPATCVTLLEDRAMVRREGVVAVKPGLNRILVRGVATVLQDVSLKAEASVSSVRVVDARARRAMRARREEAPEQARELEAQIEEIERKMREHVDERDRAAERFERSSQILSMGLAEVSQDASWGYVNPQHWKDTFEVLFQRARSLRHSIVEAHAGAERLAEELDALVVKRQLLDRVDHRFVAWVEVDLLADAALEELRFSIEYVVPNAMWRPTHSARLGRDKLEVTSSAMVWQNTGEDWDNVDLVFSTARSSLGTEPPQLSDDPLSAKKKSDAVVVTARQVAVQKASVGGAPKATGISLPGVDDGGDIRTLKAMSKHSVKGDGQANLVPLFVFETSAAVSLVAAPELSPRVYLKSVQTNSSSNAMLPGPVELIRANGFVGWTRTDFVAPGEAFSLSFGPDDAIRLVRSPQAKTEIREVDRWRVVTHEVFLFLSNLSGEPKTIEITERIPVSEIEQVKVVVNRTKSTPVESYDENGFNLLRLTLPPNGQTSGYLCYSIETAPGVQTA
ncbi:MAG: mucoidy inhibitor MuiA family protein [Polyangiaceae bacterium]